MVSAFSRIWMINLLLAVFVAWFGMMSFTVWSKGDEPIPEIQTGKNAEKPLPAKGIVERTMAPDSVYSVVAEKNVFSPSRAEFIPDKEKAGPLKISDKTIFLYGTVAMGERKQALISNPENGPAGPAAGKKQALRDKWVALGDKLGNFTVAEIKKDRIILADGATKREILLYDKSKPKRQVAAAEKPAAPSVVSTGTTAASAAPAPAPATAKSGTEPSPSRVAEGKSTPAGEFKIVNTPFGPVKRRIQ
ncbi:MAG: hypothetical protein ACYC7J_19330 [Syntrophales bacterium]